MNARCTNSPPSASPGYQTDGGVDFLSTDKDAVKLMSEFFATIDTVIMGRKTLDERRRTRAHS